MKWWVLTKFIVVIILPYIDVSNPLNVYRVTCELYLNTTEEKRKFYGWSVLLCKVWDWKVLATQSCPTLWDLKDYSPPGSTVHRISQARILDWGAIPCSRGSSQPRDRTWVSCITDSLLSEPPSPTKHIHWITHLLYYASCSKILCDYF